MTELEQCKAKIDAALREFNAAIVVRMNGDDEPLTFELTNGEQDYVNNNYIKLDSYPADEDGEYYAYDGKEYNE